MVQLPPETVYRDKIKWFLLALNILGRRFLNEPENWPSDVLGELWFLFVSTKATIKESYN